MQQWLIDIAMSSAPPVFREPTAVEKLFNRTFGALVGLGIGPAHIHILEVRGRKSGKLYRTPVDLLTLDGKQYLVAPRGQTQWVRNAEAAGEVTLKRGSTRKQFRLLAVPDADKPPILKAYLDSFQRQVQRYFTVAAGSPPEAFLKVASYYPAFELLTK
jgi:deazaflavin-dependent oxidoreductase (nitroreductase family)